MDYPYRIFLSHKVKDRGEGASRFVQALEMYADKTKLEMFVSPEIRPGEVWEPLVQEKLREAHVLILLYTDPSRDMDWCLYETGFFAAAAADRKGRLVCVLPKNVEAPGPLKGFQNIELTPNGVRELLRTVLNDDELPVKPELFDESNITVLDELVGRVLDAIGPPAERQPLCPRVWIKIPADGIAQLQHGKLPEDAWVRGETEALQQFGIGPTDGVQFDKLAEKLEFADGLPYFAPQLAQEMFKILEGKSGPFSIPPLRVMASGVARTLVFTYLEKLMTGDLQFEFVVAQPRVFFNVEESGDFMMVYHLLNLGLHFRWRVLDRNLEGLENLTMGGQSEQIHKALGSLRMDLAEVILDSFNRGLHHIPQVLRPFKRDQTAYSTLEKILEPADGLWTQAMQALDAAIEDSDVSAAIEALTKMRDINKTALVLVSRMLTEMLSGLSGTAVE